MNQKYCIGASQPLSNVLCMPLNSRGLQIQICVYGVAKERVVAKLDHWEAYFNYTLVLFRWMATIYNIETWKGLVVNKKRH